MFSPKTVYPQVPLPWHLVLFLRFLKLAILIGVRIVILTGVRIVKIVVLIFIYIMINKNNHFFISFDHLYVFFDSVYSVFNGVVCFCCKILCIFKEMCMSDV